MGWNTPLYRTAPRWLQYEQILNTMMPSVRLTLSSCGSPVSRKPFTHSQLLCPRMVIAV